MHRPKAWALAFSLLLTIVGPAFSGEWRVGGGFAPYDWGSKSGDGWSMGWVFSGNADYQIKKHLRAYGRLAYAVRTRVMDRTFVSTSSPVWSGSKPSSGPSTLVWGRGLGKDANRANLVDLNAKQLDRGIPSPGPLGDDVRTGIRIGNRVGEGRRAAGRPVADARITRFRGPNPNRRADVQDLSGRCRSNCAEAFGAPRGSWDFRALKLIAPTDSSDVCPVMSGAAPYNQTDPIWGLLIIAVTPSPSKGEGWDEGDEVDGLHGIS